MGEETFRKSERKGDSSRKGQDEFRKLREVSELEYELESKNGAVRELEQQNKHLREDIEVLEC